MVKKLLFFLLLISLFLAACGGNDEEKAKQDNTKKDNGDDNSKQVEVDKGLLNVEITLPASFFESDEDRDSTMAEAEKDGIKVTKNEDGSLTYKMSKNKHKEVMKEIKRDMVASIDEIKNSEDYVSIQDITHNDSFSEFNMIVDKAKYENSFDSFAVFGLGIAGMYYQLFSGVDPEEYQVKIQVQDAATKEILSEVIYPDDLEEMEEEQQDDKGHSGTHTGG